MAEELRIGICDDDRQIRHVLRDMVADICAQQNISCQLSLYADAPALLKDISGLSVVFLDIDMPEMDGIDAGRKILSENPDCHIIMSTGRIDRVKEAFSIRALRFVTKPFQAEEVAEALRAAMKELPGADLIELFRDRVSHMVAQRDIHYVRAFNGYVEAFTSSGSFRKDASMEEMEQMLDARMFYRIHRAYLVNFSWIQSASQVGLVVDGQTLPLARRKVADFQRKFAAYELEYGA